MNDVEVDVRLDKWLWAARFFKTRSLAKAAIEAGKVFYNNARCKPSKLVEEGATIRLKLGWQEQTVSVKLVSNRRRGAGAAQAMYSETAESINQRAERAEQAKSMQLAMAAPRAKPNKKQRRDLLRVRQQFTDS